MPLALPNHLLIALLHCTSCVAGPTMNPRYSPLCTTANCWNSRPLDNGRFDMLEVFVKTRNQLALGRLKPKIGTLLRNKKSAGKLVSSFHIQLTPDPTNAYRSA